jgi:ABC-type Mn2+/Zn2+ transport system ATPase subunit
MWSDNETDVDLLQFRYLAASVVRIVGMPHLLPTTIGVFGDWGTGKSSLIKMIEKELAKDPIPSISRSAGGCSRTMKTLRPH